MQTETPKEAPKAAPGPTPKAEELDSAAPAPAADQKPATNAQPPKEGPVTKIRKVVNIYLAIFILMIGALGAVIFVTIKPPKPTTTTSLGKLTDKQLSALKGNTTFVGDAKQTLDVQSNAIFEGQVLVRSDLNVAGALKIGAGISLPTLTVAGAGNFGQLGTTGPLAVGGDTSLQGQLTVQKNLNVTGTASFGALSVSSLSVTSLQVKNDFSISKHIVTSGGTPSRSGGTALGGGGTASVSGSDTAGTVTINTGNSPPAGLFVTLSFAQKFSSTPHIVITPIGSTAASLQYYVNRDANGFSIGTANAPPASSSFGFDYIVIN